MVTRTVSLEQSIHDVVVANRILAHEGVVDAYGHVSVRHPLRPDRFLLSRSRSPELVEAGDIMEFTLEGTPVGENLPAAYAERFIHAGMYEARPDVNAVIHGHALEVLPFTVGSVALRPVIGSASDMGANVPLWDIRDRFGDTTLRVANVEQGRDLAKCLGPNRVVLMRGHGFTVVGRTIVDAVKLGVYLPNNARVLKEALLLGGEVKPLSPGEIEIRSKVDPYAPEQQRSWECWALSAGVKPYL